MTPSPSSSRICNVVLAACACVASGCHQATARGLGPIMPIAAVTTITGVGFDAPENVVYDSVADVFLVSNIVGDPAAHDGNGFVSRVSPDGRLLERRWIAGGVRGATLDAPKGLAIHGDTLAIADLGAVHLFDRRTGAPLGSIALPGLVMNDVLFAPDGALWITDTGPDRTTTPVDTTHDMDAVWRVGRDGHPSSVSRTLTLDRPDGIAWDGASPIVATFGAHRLERVDASLPGGWTMLCPLPAGRVDGLRRLPDGTFVVTSWDAQAVWHLTLDGREPHVVPLLGGVQSPAGVALDTRRQRLAVEHRAQRRADDALHRLGQIGMTQFIPAFTTRDETLRELAGK